VVCVEDDPEEVAASREALTRAGLYGGRVVVHHVDAERLPYAAYLANLVVWESDQPPATLPWLGEARRMLRPGGGAMVCTVPSTARTVDVMEPLRASEGYSAALAAGTDEATVMVYRDALPGAGEWTHLYGDAANSACSDDAIAGGTEYDLQWFGPPGPGDAVDRHHNGMGPLFKDGRLFVLGVDHVTAVDAYNGTVLWEREIENSTRMGVGYEGGSACVDSRRFYIAAGAQCRALDPATGREREAFTGPEEGRDWGYVAVADGLLIGTNQAPAASFRDYRQREKRTNQFGMVGGRHIVSTSLFAVDPQSGKRAWAYMPESAVLLNSSIAVSGGVIVFAESSSPAAVGQEDNFVPLADFLQDARLVATDLQSGRRLWDVPLQVRGEEILYGQVGGGVVLVTSTYYGDEKEPARRGRQEHFVYYDLNAYSPKTGEHLWKATIRGCEKGRAHNTNIQHPAIIGGRAYLSIRYVGELNIIDLATGEVSVDPNYRRNDKGCGVLTAAQDALFFRNMSCESYDLTAREHVPISTISRPSCWVGTLPAGGLVMVPEGTAGCNCAFPLQTSIVMAPRRSGENAGSAVESPE
jgi:outer membrane protein assembly factor BamB